MYHLFLIVSAACFGYHSLVHVLEYFGLLGENEKLYLSVGIAMFLGWISYFYMSFADPFMGGFSAVNLLGIPVLVAGFYLFTESHRRIHEKKRHGKKSLIREGIYRYFRHPMYLGEILLLLGAPVLGGSALTLMISPIFIIQVLLWRYLEEIEMMGRFPEYGEYRKKTIF